jgi:hypothetical protein
MQIRTVWWMWKNFPAPGGQEIVVAALWGCALSCKRWTPLIIILVSCQTASLSFCRIPCIYCWTEVWKQPTELSKHCRKQHLLLSLPGHWFSLALWGVVEDQSLFSCTTYLRMPHHALRNGEGASGTVPGMFLCSSVSGWETFLEQTFLLLLCGGEYMYWQPMLANSMQESFQCE